MIYVVVGYDWEEYQNFFASTSKEKAEKKLAEVIERYEKLIPARDEFDEWQSNHPEIFHAGDDPEVEAKIHTMYEDKEAELEAKYNLRKGGLSDSVHLKFRIEEVESD